MPNLEAYTNSYSPQHNNESGWYDNPGNLYPTCSELIRTPFDYHIAVIGHGNKLAVGYW